MTVVNAPDWTGSVGRRHELILSLERGLGIS
jgi:hypothetical protein